MRKYFIFVVVVLFFIECNSKEPGAENKFQESIKSEEKVDTLAVMDQEPIVEKITEQVSKQTEEKEEKDPSEDEAILWNSYRSAKDAVKQAQSEEDYKKQIKYLLEAAVYAKALQRYDIEAWQYNNAGYVLIEEFKEKTDYLVVMNNLNKLELKIEIEEYRKEARKQLSKEKGLLSKAEGYLAKAKEIDDKLEESSRTTTIASNILFVNEVMNFLEAGKNE
ncbi:MAG: hypothetical protein HQ534_04605 [Armatimonadetes bacterium]|nr:hypothetical protein [Armatimonadota bacterium]